MGIHHAVIAKAARNGITITEDGSDFVCTKDGAVLAKDVTARDALAAAIVELTAKTPKEDTTVAKTAKKAAKAKTKKAPKAAKNGAGKTEAKTIVSDEYRANYNADDNCGDKIAKAITDYVKNGKVLDMDKLKKLAEDNDISLSKWASLNNGQKSMNLRNVLRARAKRGDKVKVAGRIFE
jgi:hypothetical protein